MRVLALMVSITTFGALLAVTTPTATVEAATEVQASTSADADSDSEDITLLSKKKDNSVVNELASADANDEEEVNSEESERNKEEDKDKDPEPINHTVERGETLTKIARQHDTEWVRLWQKNKNLEHPDVLAIGEELVIPFKDEDLDDRELPEPADEPAGSETVSRETSNNVSRESSSTSQQAQTQSQSPTETSQQQRERRQQRQQRERRQQQRQQQQARNRSRQRTAGNTYTAGYCTWYVKNQRPDIPNGLGNANMWLRNARAAGMSTGSQPRVGAVAQTTAYGYGHVAIVTAVHGNGTITVSEMNFTGFNQVSSRTVSASSFNYIY